MKSSSVPEFRNLHYGETGSFIGMKVLITGVTGMAGSHLADLLLAQEPKVEIFGTKRWRSQTANIDHLVGQAQFIDCDLTDASACDELLGRIRPDYIFHLAAQSFVPESWKSPRATIVDNVTMQLNLFEAIRRNKLDPIFQVALSSEEYGKVYPDEVPITEKNPLRPLSPYGVSKVAQDMLAYQYHESHGLRAIRTRTFNHEGPRRGDVFVTSNFAKQIAQIELGLVPPVVKVGNLSAKRDWSDVRDVVHAYWLGAQKCTPGEDYVIASGTARTIQNMLDLLISFSKKKIEIQVDPERLRPSDVEILQGDSTKFRRATGWEPKIPFEKTMEDLLNYWRQKVRQSKESGVTS
jgi:GDP-4-dehydro-6-deoxy-D-mannose reductase